MAAGADRRAATSVPAPAACQCLVTLAHRFFGGARSPDRRIRHYPAMPASADWRNRVRPLPSNSPVTWILGQASIFGYGALIGDTRVTLRDGRSVDVLQKIHVVAPNMIAGFAGSVRLGFAMIDDMRVAFAGPLTHRWWPRAAAHWWRRRGRAIFTAAEANESRLGSELLLVGPAPDDQEPWPRAYCLRLRSPDFVMEDCRVVQWHGIGSGTSHVSASLFAESYRERFVETFGQAEIQDPGGAARRTAVAVSEQLWRNPLASVSEGLQCGLAFLNHTSIQNFNSEYVQPDGTTARRKVGLLAQSWPQFTQIVSSQRAESSLASA